MTFFKSFCYSKKEGISFTVEFSTPGQSQRFESCFFRVRWPKNFMKILDVDFLLMLIFTHLYILWMFCWFEMHLFCFLVQVTEFVDCQKSSKRHHRDAKTISRDHRWLWSGEIPYSALRQNQSRNTSGILFLLHDLHITFNLGIMSCCRLGVRTEEIPSIIFEMLYQFLLRLKRNFPTFSMQARPVSLIRIHYSYSVYNSHSNIYRRRHFVPISLQIPRNIPLKKNPKDKSVKKELGCVKEHVCDLHCDFYGVFCGSYSLIRYNLIHFAALAVGTVLLKQLISLSVRL